MFLYYFNERDGIIWKMLRSGLISYFWLDIIIIKGGLLIILKMLKFLNISFYLDVNEYYVFYGIKLFYVENIVRKGIDLCKVMEKLLFG